MPVAIVTDASIDLPPDEAAASGIFLAPLHYELGGQRHASWEQTPEAFYDALEGTTATISGVDSEDFEAAFRTAAASHEQILCVCQSFGSSFTYVAAQVAARDVAHETGVTIRIVNTGRSSAAQAAITVAAAEAAGAASDADALLATVEQLAPRAETFLIAPAVDQLERAGQLSIVGTQSGVGRLEEGVPLYRVRDRLRAINLADDRAAAEAALVEQAATVAGDDEAIVVATHAGAPEAAARIAEAVANRVGVRRQLTTDLGPMIGALLGRGTYGVGLVAVS
jgi:DegV family protein with EDD domain